MRSNPQHGASTHAGIDTTLRLTCKSSTRPEARMPRESQINDAEAVCFDHSRVEVPHVAVCDREGQRRLAPCCPLAGNDLSGALVRRREVFEAWSIQDCKKKADTGFSFEVRRPNGSNQWQAPSSQGTLCQRFSDFDAIGFALTSVAALDAIGSTLTSVPWFC